MSDADQQGIDQLHAEILFPGWTKTRAAVDSHGGYGTHGRRINPTRTPAR